MYRLLPISKIFFIIFLKAFTLAKALPIKGLVKNGCLTEGMKYVQILLKPFTAKDFRFISLEMQSL